MCQGSLSLKKITPMIEVLFSGFYFDKLESTQLSSSVKFFSDDEDDMRLDTNFIVEKLIESASKFGLSANFDMRDEDVFLLYADYFKVENKDEFLAFTKGIDKDYSFTFDQLYTLAKYFDDGHGLYLIKYTSSYSDEVESFGESVLVTDMFNFVNNSSDELNFNVSLNDFLSTNQYPALEDAIGERIENFFSSIKNTMLRDKIKQSLINKLIS